MYPVTQKVQTNNRTHKKFKPVGIVVHETATPGATDESESDYFNKTTRKASVHAFIDWDSITQKIPVDEVAWHAGPTANNRYLGIELCHATTKAQFSEVWKRAVWYFAWLFVNYLRIYTVTQQNLPSHADCTRWWHETDHTDPESYFKEYSKTVQDFRDDVQKEINNQLKPLVKPTIKPTIKPMSVPLIVIPATLHCRVNPSTLCKVVKDFHHGDKLTAIGEEGSWWKLDINGTPGYVSKEYTKEAK